MDKLYTVTMGAPLLGMKPNTLRKLAREHDWGMQPGGSGTPRLFTLEQLLEIRDRSRKWSKVEELEDRDALGLGPIYPVKAGK